MKNHNPQIEKMRIKNGPMASDESYGNNGVFKVRCPETKRLLIVIVSDGDGWDHASVSIANRPNDAPNWAEMCYVKGLFWEPNECVIQFHPPNVEYVNLHNGCLHLWKPQRVEISMPPIVMV